MCGIGPGRTACPSGGNRCPFSFPFIFHKATTHNEENNEDNREPHPTGRQHGEKKKEEGSLVATHGVDCSRSSVPP